MGRPGLYADADVQPESDLITHAFRQAASRIMDLTSTRGARLADWTLHWSTGARQAMIDGQPRALGAGGG